MKVGKIFASAGCGKTTKLISITEQLLESGTPPTRIMFTTFTRSGAHEAKERAISKFTQFNENQFQWFATLHSICYRVCSCPPVMTLKDYRILGQKLGCKFGNPVSYTDASEAGKGDAMLTLYNYQRNMCLQDVIPEDHEVFISKQEYDHFVATYDDYRATYGKSDYTDLIDEACSSEPLPISYAIVDEAQDLTQLQWKTIKALSRNARWLWLAGDDDQSIYTYSGADPSILIDLRADRVVHLETSYRLPPIISAYANKLALNISKREPKTIRPRPADRQTLEYANDFSQIDIDPSEKVAVLLRNRSFAPFVAEQLLANGHLYINNCVQHDKLGDIVKAAHTWNRLLAGEEFYGSELADCAKYIPCPLWRNCDRAILKESDKKTNLADLIKHHRLLKTGTWDKVLELPHKDFLLNKWNGNEPNVLINTIHTFKGREVDHAIVLSDMSRLSYKTLQLEPDSEHRVFFVAVTRARYKLTILRPMTSTFYPL